MSVHGLLLAAGAGRRMGRPKALVEGWLAAALDVLERGGCDGRTVVLGAAHEEARALVPEGIEVVVAEDWADGMGASLRAGLAALVTTSAVADAEAVLVHLVDLPDVTAEVVARVLGADTGPETLARAAYDGKPGHPVLIGRAHWAGVIETARGDRGARDYLASHEVTLVECGDLATGADIDRPGEGSP